MRKLLKGAGGFTLIELMIVILIIAILVAIAVPVYIDSRNNAQRRTCQGNLRTVDDSIQAYSSIMDGDYPGSLADMTEPGTKTLKKVYACPQGGNYTWVAGNPPEISCPNDASHTL